MHPTQLERAVENLVILIAESNAHTRRLTRTMLTNLGVRSFYEAVDGVAALDFVRNVNPDVMLLDWTMPLLDGRQVMRIVRSPGVFPMPNLPIIMLTDVGLRSRVEEAMLLGAHELLLKPLSPKRLQQRLLGVLLHPRPMIQAGEHYVPLPRRALDIRDL